MKKSVLAIILIFLLIPLTQAFFPFTGFAINKEEKIPEFSCQKGYEKTGEFSCTPICTVRGNYIQLGNKNIYPYCFSSKVLYEPVCANLKVDYKKTICPEGCKDGKCQILERCKDNTPIGSCSKDLNSYCSKEKEIITCNENEICKKGVCTSSSDCDKNNGLTAIGFCPTGFKPIPSTIIAKQANTQCCIPVASPLPITTIDEAATCEDNTPVGKCSETQPYLCTHEQILVRDCQKCGCPLNEKCNMEDPMVCTKIQDITKEFYETIGLEEEKPLLSPQIGLLKLPSLPSNFIPISLFSPPPTTNKEPTITRAYVDSKGNVEIKVGDKASFTIGKSIGGMPGKISFYF